MISPFFKKLLFARQVNIDKGEFKLLDKNFSLLSAKNLTVLRDSLAKTDKIELFYELGKDLSKDIIELFNKFGGKKEEAIKFWLNMLSISGFGNVEIVETNPEKGAIVNCNNSSIAVSYLKNNKKGKVDELMAGIIAGFFEFVFEKDVLCTEETCIANGDRQCQFKVILNQK